MTPLPLTGISHVGLSVPDVDAAVLFWHDVMGLEVVGRTPSYCLLLHREGLFVLGLNDHEGAVTGPFDERRTGLDHIALAIPDAAALEEWIQRFDEHGVAHADPVETDFGVHLNVRAPDSFPVELFVLAPSGATRLGLDEEVSARA
jgi:catechol 2,3-dioxygenase-like lactoylglutathione lyase family enzyme